MLAGRTTRRGHYGVTIRHLVFTNYQLPRCITIHHHRVVVCGGVGGLYDSGATCENFTFLYHFVSAVSLSFPRIFEYSKSSIQ